MTQVLPFDLPIVWVAAVIVMIALPVMGAAAFAAARRNLRHLREALDAMGDGVAVWGPDDRLVAWNTRYAELCKTSAWTPA